MPHRRRGLGLTRNDPNSLVKFIRNDAIAGSATAAARGSDDHIDVGQVFENLEAYGADAGNQLWLVRRMDVTKPFGAGNALTFQARLIKIAAVQTDFGAQVAHQIGRASCRER